jgi:hypothetical protein
VIAGLLFLMPFIAVSCDAPGGFGRAAPGGTTDYSGVVLATGGSPKVTADKVREGNDQKLPPQPLALVALLMVVAGAVVTAVVNQVVLRRAIATVLAGLAAVCVTVNQVLVTTLLQNRLLEQLTVPMPAGKSAASFVQNQTGFWICVSTLVILVMGYGAGWIRNTSPD